MFKKFALVGALVLTSACASFHTVTYAAPFEMQLEIREAHGTVPTYVTDIGGDSLLDYVPKLVDIAKEIGYQVEVVGQLETDQGDELWGYTDKDKKIVYISLDQSVNNFVHTFVHELSHAMQPMPLSPEGQVFAETVATLVTTNLGVQSQDSAMSYIVRFPKHDEVIQQYSVAIDNLVKFFLEHLKA